MIVCYDKSVKTIDLSRQISTSLQSALDNLKRIDDCLPGQDSEPDRFSFEFSDGFSIPSHPMIETVAGNGGTVFQFVSVKAFLFTRDVMTDFA